MIDVKNKFRDGRACTTTYYCTGLFRTTPFYEKIEGINLEKQLEYCNS